jgi:hypothetical protein
MDLNCLTRGEVDAHAIHVARHAQDKTSDVLYFRATKTTLDLKMNIAFLLH